MRSRFAGICRMSGRTCSPSAMPTATMPRRRRAADGDRDVPHDGRRMHRREGGDLVVPGLYTCGISYLGAAKDQQRRLLLGFNVFAPSLEGVTFGAGTFVNSA